jgi:D-psicose/D-tagatose/L-ribulose 3-epimerase
MKLGICTSPDHLTDVHAAGFDFAELGSSFLLYDKPEADFAPVRQALQASPIPIEAFNVFLPGTQRVTGPDVDLKAVGAHMETVLRRASEVGGKIMVFGSGGARRVPEGWPMEKARAQFVEAARLAGETAAHHNMTIALEPLWKKACNFFNRTDQGAAFVDLAAHPNLRLLTDLFHMTWENEPFENMIKAGPRLAHIHLATPTLPETGTDNGPGYDLRRFLVVLRQAGYDGRLSVEDNNGLLGKSPLPRVQVLAAVRKHVAACAR